jgi:hypothetical protein
MKIISDRKYGSERKEERTTSEGNGSMSGRKAHIGK